MQLIQVKTVDGKQVEEPATLLVRNSSGDAPATLEDLYAAGICKRSDALTLVKEIKEKANRQVEEYKDTHDAAIEAIRAILEAYQDCEENGFLDSFADTTALETAIEAARELL